MAWAADETHLRLLPHVRSSWTLHLWYGTLYSPHDSPIERV
ncbi:hypothetical protein OHU34_41285 [Streptomyces sp. NBC_00080]